MLRSKTLCILTLSLSLALALVACGKDDPAPVTPDTDPTTEQGDALPDAPDPADMGTPDEPAAQASTAQADALIQQITALIGQDNIGEAKNALAKLEAMAGSLPASYQDEIAKAKQLVDGSGMANEAQNLTEGLGIGGGD